MRAGLAAATQDGIYNEKVLFKDYFPEQQAEESASDADVEFDYTGVEFNTPDMNEMELLAQMLQDDMVTIDGAPLEGPGAVQVHREDTGEELPALPPPRDFDPTAVEQDLEWT